MGSAQMCMVLSISTLELNLTALQSHALNANLSSNLETLAVKLGGRLTIPVVRPMNTEEAANQKDFSTERYQKHDLNNLKFIWNI